MVPQMDMPGVNVRRLKADILAGLTTRTLTRKYQISEETLAKIVSAFLESGDLKHGDLDHLYSSSDIIRSLTWQCRYCRKIVPAAYDTCTRCGNSAA